MSGTERPLRIAVAGGSIGGLCAGLALRGAGFDVQVYERVAGPMETRGAGIVVQGELIDLLRTHSAGALPTTHCRMRRYLSPEGGEGEVQRAPQDFTSWEAIYCTLAAAFPADRRLRRDADRVRPGTGRLRRGARATVGRLNVMCSDGGEIAWLTRPGTATLRCESFDSPGIATTPAHGKFATFSNAVSSSLSGSSSRPRGLPPRARPRP